MAIVVNGGVQSGLFSQGIPSLVILINHLSKKYDLTIYSLAPTTNGSSSLTIKSPPAFLKFNRVRITYMFLTLLIDHYRRGFDMIQGFWGFPSGLVTGYFKAITGVPTIVTLMGGETASLKEIGYGRLISQHGKKKVHSLINRTSVLIPISQFQLNILKEGHFDTSKCEVIPFGVPEDLFHPNTDSIEEKVIIHIGNINLIKDHPTLLSAFEMINESIRCRLWICGADYLNGDIQLLAKQNKWASQITFHSALPYHKIAELLRNSSLMLHTSLYEGQAVVFCEAMAAGIPVCSTDVGLMSDLSPECCLVSPVGDAKSLAKNAIKVLEDKDLYNRLRMNGREWALRHNDRWTAEQYFDVYERLIKN